MEISKMNTFYNSNRNNLTIGIKEIKFIKVLDNSIQSFFIEKYVYVSPSLEGFLTTDENEHLHTLKNFGYAHELAEFIIRNNHDYQMTKTPNCLLAIDLEDFNNMKDEQIIYLLDILNWSKFKYPIRFFFYTDNLLKYKDCFWFETVMTCIEDYTFGSLIDEDKSYLYEQGLLTDKDLSIFDKKDEVLIYKGSD